MDDRERALQLGVAQVGVEAGELGRGQHPLVDDRPRAEARDRERRARLELGEPAGDEQAPLELVLVDHLRPGADQELAELRGDVARRLAAAREVDRDLAPAQRQLAGGDHRLLEQALLGLPQGRVAGEEDARDRDPARVGELGAGDPELAHARAQEAVGELDQDPGAVAGARVGARGAAVLEVVERRQRQVDDVVARLAVEAGDAGDAATVVLDRTGRRARQRASAAADCAGAARSPSPIYGRRGRNRAAGRAQPPGSGVSEPTASAIGSRPLRRSKVSPIVCGWSSTAARVAATSSRVTSPPWSSGVPTSIRPVPRIVGEPPRADDRVLEPGGPQRRVGLALGLVVRLHLGRVGVGAVDVERADHQVAADAGALAGLDQLDAPRRGPRCACAPRRFPGRRRRRRRRRRSPRPRRRAPRRSRPRGRATTAWAPTASRSPAWSGLRIRPRARSPRSASTRAAAGRSCRGRRRRGRSCAPRYSPRVCAVRAECHLATDIR